MLVTRRSAAALLVATGLLAAGCGRSGPAKTTEVAAKGADFRGFALSAPFDLPAGPLVDTAGRPTSLRAGAAGHVTLVYFGYTNCQDTCPAVMAAVARALEQVPAATRDRVRVLFVTTDPRRDTGPVMRRWLDRFSPSFTGLTGSADQLTAVYHAVGIDPKVVMKPGGAEEVEHSADLYAAGPDGVVRLGYDPDATVADYVHDLPELAAGRTPGGVSADSLAATGGTGRAGLDKLFSVFVDVTPDGTARLRATVVSVDDRGDRLLGVTGPDVRSATFSQDGRGVDALRLPAETPVAVGGPAASVLLTTATPLRPGRTVRLTFTFAHGGRTTLTVPVDGALSPPASGGSSA